MRIDNLCFIKHIDDKIKVMGRAGTTATSYALALGPSTVTRASATSQARALPNGGSLSIARGSGFARGTETTAFVEVAGFGDIVVGATTSTPNIGATPVNVAHGVVVAIDLPRHR